jgi:DNA-binding HxlR family transcriptional regulator
MPDEMLTMRGSSLARSSGRVAWASLEYSLSPLGRTLEKPLVAICEWAMAHLDQLRDARATQART